MSDSRVIISRRRFLQGLAARIAVPAAAGFPAHALLAPVSPLVRGITRSPEGSYFTYPHAQGFLPGGRCVVARTILRPPGLEYLAFRPSTGETIPIARVRDARMYFALDKKGMLVFTRKHGVYMLDAGRSDSEPRPMHQDPPWVFHSDCDISADGRQVLVTTSLADGQPPRHRVVMVDVSSGQAETLFEADWLIDHAHFSPFDPNWIAFASAESKRYQRLWVWHRVQAPEGRHLFRQRLSDGSVYDVGHERAMFDRPALLAIAYGSNSSARPCGLFEVGFDGSSRLVSASNRDLHCNASRDGRWAVVSLQGTSENLMERIAPGWLDTPEGYGPSDVMVVNMRSGARQFLYRAYNSAMGQPYEVQPAISPDGRWVMVKDARERCVLALEMDTTRLAAFLA